jgi:outer membrane protein OmpA-like peptidoglycan-associated protein
VLKATFFLLAALAPALLSAGEVHYRFKDRVLVGQGAPELLLSPDQTMRSLLLKLTREDGKAIRKQYKGLKAGQERAIKLPRDKGVATWRVTATGTFGDGSQLDQVFGMTTAVLDPLAILLDKRDVNLDEGELQFSLPREGEQVKVTVYGHSGEVVEETEHDITGQRRNIRLAFDRNDGDIGRLVIRATDRWAFWAEAELTPWAIDIPHEEVTFEFGQAEVRPSEAPKLQHSLRLIHEALAKFGANELKVRLYVAGYTDTVGGRADNQRLSEARARSIAEWFTGHGLSIPILYQGFGEDVLFKVTPDDTPEAANRRAAYLLGTQAPSDPAAIPRQAWRRLK